LAGYRRVAMNFDRQHSARVRGVQRFGSGSRDTLYDRIHNLQMRRVEGEHHIDRSIAGLRDTAEPLVIFDVAGRQLACVLAVELIE
jgi:hypothetical protein